ncbi:uncharacterized protein [Palaemon carinicauda]|uniref:uncharacterized protein n=1 Tax=Palaemon carinicauda TaxID=392227 RepID=UPI0035B5919D
MVKLLLFPFALILAFASAQAVDKKSITDSYISVELRFTLSSHKFLASWTSDINNEITFEGCRVLYSPQRLFKYTINSLQSNTWNLFTIYTSHSEVIINPGNRRYTVDWSYDLKISIKSTKRTYWRFCKYQCDRSAPDPHATKFPAGSTTTQSSIVSSTTQSSIVSSTTQSSIVSSTTQSSIVSSTVPTPSTRDTALNFITIVSLSICCVLVAIVIGMAVYIIRGRRASLNEPARNLEPENISHNPQMFNVSTFSSPQEDHESINSLCGVTINRESPQ